MPYTTNSADDIGISAGSAISLGQLRTWFQKTGAVSLNSSFNNSDAGVPATLPAAGATTKLSDYYDSRRVMEKIGTVSQYTTTQNITRPNATDAVLYHVWVVGGGASGGVGRGDGGQEAVGSGGGAGGVGFRAYTAAEFQSGTNVSTITIGARGDSSARSSSGGTSGEDGGTSSFAPSGTGVTLYATGGIRGFGSFQGADTGTADANAAPNDAEPTNPTYATGTAQPVGNNSGAQNVPAGYEGWGGCSRSEGGYAVNAGPIPPDHPAYGNASVASFYGGQGPGFNAGASGQSNRGSTARDAKGASGGGNISFGWDYNTDGTVDGRNGYAVLGSWDGSGGAFQYIGVRPEPTKPAEFESDVTGIFLGGAGAISGVGHATAYTAWGPGAGGGGAATHTSGTATSGAGFAGAVYIVSYKVAGT